MIRFSVLGDASDLVAFSSLLVLAVVFGLLPADQVMGCWIRKRREVALIWAIACLHRGAELVRCEPGVNATHVLSAVVVLLSAITALQHLMRRRHAG